MFFADKAVIAGPSEQQVQSLLDYFSAVCHDFSLNISLMKMQVMAQASPCSPNLTIKNFQHKVVHRGSKQLLARHGVRACIVSLHCGHLKPKIKLIPGFVTGGHGHCEKSGFIFKFSTKFSLFSTWRGTCNSKGIKSNVENVCYITFWKNSRVPGTSRTTRQRFPLDDHA